MYSFYDTEKMFGKLLRSRLFIVAFISLFLFATVGCLNVYAAEVTVVCNGEQTTLVTSDPTPNPKSLIKGAEIDLADGQDYELTQKSGQWTLKIGTRVDVTVIRADKTREFSLIFTGTETVADALCLCDIEIASTDVITPAVDTLLKNDTIITAGVVSYTVTEETAVIPFETVYTENATLSKGIKKVITVGKNGSMKKMVKNILVDGVVTEKIVLSETVVAEPVTEKIEKGTYVKYTAGTVKYAEFENAATTPVTNNPAINEKLISPLAPDTPIQLDKNGVPTSFSQVIKGKATAYSPEDGKWTATGAPAQMGYVAVDPTQIPYGSLLYIRCPDHSYIYGYAIAADTGGFVDIGIVTVDLFFPNTAEGNKFGIRNVEIYVL